MADTAPVPPATLDYRTPGVGAHRARVVLAALNRDQAMGTAAAVGKLAAGVALTLIGPLLVAVLAKGIDRRGPGGALPPFGVVFGLACLAVVPWAMWYERRTRGRFQDDALAGQGNPLGASSRGEYELESARVTWTMYVETALLGPRLLWHVYDWARGTPDVDLPVRAAAAELLVELLDAGEGVAVRKLLRANRTAAQVRGALRYLQAREWVDLSKRNDRVWVTTMGRERLGRMAKQNAECRMMNAESKAGA